ncbi:MAG: hypothetical protein IJ128_06485 [Firmicutes bacterium]|nr:hypothetical protein [Bacillota bacterium]
MKRSTRGYYTIEAALLLPLVLLMVLALGYYTKAQGSWENAFHCAADESCIASAMSWDGVSGYTAGMRIQRRLAKDGTNLSGYEVRDLLCDHSDGKRDHLTSYELAVSSDLRLPAGFGRLLRFSSRVKYRGFVGQSYRGDPLGTEGLENDLPEDPVWIFPQSGQKYHTKTCTYVKATVHSVVLTSRVRSEYGACSTCRSETIPAGSIVYCFDGKDTAYHRGSCRTIKRRTAVIDRTEAIQKGYTPCSKCGGGK